MQTPIYVYSLSELTSNYTKVSTALNTVAENVTIAFSMKSCNNPEVLRKLISLGSGIDCVSLGELKRAILCGCPPSQIVLAGVGKTDDEIRLAIESDILQINAESNEELIVINEIAGKIGKKANISLRINPHLEEKNYTHDKISTGSKGNKFGIDISDVSQTFALLKTLDNIKFKGFACHIGSQIFDLGVFKSAFKNIRELIVSAEKEGFASQTIDLGGGMGVPYTVEDPTFDFESYAKIAKECISGLNIKSVIFEPGRSISATAGVLISKVLFVKRTSHATFLILDAGMHNLIRPAMYGARHNITPLKQNDLPHEKYIICGPVCESSDVFGEYTMPQMKRGDCVIIHNAGAYGEVMQSEYNIKMKEEKSVCVLEYNDIYSQF